MSKRARPRLDLSTTGKVASEETGKVASEGEETGKVASEAALATGKVASDNEIDATIRDLKPHQAKEFLIDRDIKNGNFRRIWDASVKQALRGDPKARDWYWDRVLGKPGQQVAFVGEVRHTISDEDRAVLDGIASALGMKKPKPVVARVVEQSDGEEAQP
jgi:hypothetical protein